MISDAKLIMLDEVLVMFNVFDIIVYVFRYQFHDVWCSFHYFRYIFCDSYDLQCQIHVVSTQCL